FGDTKGNVVHLFERDCTLQRRNQKVIEEAPAPGMSAQLREKICGAAVTLAKSVNYEGAGTVEFLVEGGTLDASAKWYFIEMNTRLQVEHPVTEAITGLDLVEWQLRVASGEPIPLAQAAIKMLGHAIEARLCAEDPDANFMPSIGTIRAFEPSSRKDLRLETGVESGSVVSPYYDSMIAKLIVAAPDRAHALASLADALATTHVLGVKTNIGFLHALCVHKGVMAAEMDTGLIGRDIATLTQSRSSPRAIALGARALLTSKAAKANLHSVKAPDPFGARDAFQMSGKRSVAIPVMVDGKPEKAHATWASDHVDVICGDTLGRWADERHTAHSIMSTDGRGLVSVFGSTAYVSDNLRHTTVAFPDYDASALDDDAGTGAIRAPINGRVAKLFVVKGDTVEKGQRIAVVEAMKMEHVLTAGLGGTIDKLPAVEGAQVAQGALLATIVPA
ncbi:MAG: biotin/lipoyl-containing protein, partial [Hyphomicrobiaceae bacterium]